MTPAGLRMQIRSSWGDGELQAGLLGRFNAHNLLAALAALLALDMPFEQALARLARTATVPGRMERLGGESGQPLAIIDYALPPMPWSRFWARCGNTAVVGCGACSAAVATATLASDP